MKLALKLAAGLLVLLLLAVGGGFLWAKSATAAKLARTIDVHRADFPVPYPLADAELAALREERRAARAPAREAGAADSAAGDAEGPSATPGAAPAADDAAEADPLAGVDLAALALERAIARGKHLVEARYACGECHGRDFGGGTMIDDPAIGTILGPNITHGEGNVIDGYTAADWDRIVRHGVNRDGRPSAMPAEDFQHMTDQELSDVIAYVTSQPPVNKRVPRPALGPVGTVLMATGKMPLSADLIGEHHAAHAARPPTTEPTAEFGRHLASVCTGCHRPGLEGGPVAAGPPDWPPASNLTPHAEGLAGWSYDDFVKAMREAVRPDGAAVRAPMSQLSSYAKQMKDVELQALWSYLQSVEPRPDGQ